MYHFYIVEQPIRIPTRCGFGFFSDCAYVLSLKEMFNFISARANNRTPRNMYTVNLAISGILVGVFCVPPTMVQILYGGWWHFGLFACKLVPAIQGIINAK